MAKRLTTQTAKTIALEDAITALLNAKNASYHKGDSLYEKDIMDVLIARTRTHFNKETHTLRDIDTSNGRNIGLVRFGDVPKIVNANNKLIHSIEQSEINNVKNVMRSIINEEKVEEELQGILEYVDIKNGGLIDKRFEYKDNKGNVFKSINPVKDYMVKAKALENLCSKHIEFVKDHPEATKIKNLLPYTKKGPGRPKGAKNKKKVKSSLPIVKRGPGRPKGAKNKHTL